ncbi:MAG: hypothetical protein GVY36_14670 [Verrucomicrobia bacterium]|jgi:hypothetical protein|nr:hypothetical protein [Verrucomicrobiota bacterium]
MKTLSLAPLLLILGLLVAGPLAAQSVTSGQRVSGTLSPIGDIDSWTIAVEAGITLRVGVGEVSGTNFEPFLEIFQPGGDRVASNSGSVSADAVHTAAVSGIFTVTLKDASSTPNGTGNYEIYFALSKGPFMVPSGDEGGAIFSGERHSGTIDLGDADLWSFEVSAGEAIRLAVAETSGAGFTPFLLLYGPDGSLLGSNSGSSSADVVVNASVAGTYTAVVQDGNTDVSGTGAYELFLSVLGRSFTVPSGDEGGSISSGERHNGTIDLGDADLWSFEASADETIRLAVAETSGADFRPFLLLYGPDGSQLGSNSGTSSADVVVSAGVAGTYTVMVQDGNADVSGTGAYELFLSVPGRPFAVPPGDEGGTIAGGASVNGQIDLGDMDVFSFTAGSGDVVSASVQETAGSGFTPVVLLYAPDGSFVALDSDSSLASISETLSVGGQYFVVIQDFSSDVSGNGSYNLNFSRTPGGVSPPSASLSGSLGNGSSADGTIGVVGDVDRWNFSANAGERVWVQLGELSGTVFSPSLAVFDPSGTPVALDIGSSSAAVSFVASQSGTYSAYVREAGDDSTGGYRIFLSRSAGVFSVPTGDEGGTLSNGLNEEGVITLGDIDLWDFEVSAGEPVRVQLGELSGTVFSPFVEIYDGSGGLVARSSGSNSAGVFFTASSGGTYRALVRESGGDASGSYRLYFARTSQPFSVGTSDQGSGLEDGAVLSGSIEIGDIDQYGFHTEVGDEVLLSLSEVSGTVFSPLIAVRGPDGKLVAVDSGSSLAEVSFEAFATGRYTILVRESGNDSSGTYQLTATGMTAEPVEARLRQPDSPAAPAGELILAWPSPSSDWVLQESLTLESDDWSESTVPPTDNGFEKSVRVDTTAADKAFFRLIQP